MTKDDMKHRLKMWQLMYKLGLDDTHWWFTDEEAKLHAQIQECTPIVAIAGKHTWIDGL